MDSTAESDRSMRVGIISCEILCREVAEMLRRSGIRDVLIIIPEDDPAAHMRMIFVNNRLMRLPDARMIRSSELRDRMREMRGDVAILRVTEVRAHDKPHLLLSEIERSVYEMKDFVDFIILGYGLCGNSEREVRDALNRMERNARIPIYMPSDSRGYFNNCIEMILGRDRVNRILKETSGTFFMTPSGASIVGEPHVILCDSHAEDSAAVMKIMQKHYEQVVKIVYSADKYDKEYSEIVEKFARRFNLRVRTEEASPDVLIRTFERALLAMRRDALVSDEMRDEMPKCRLSE